MKGCNKISCLILLMIFPFVFIYPQTKQYKFRHITPKDGLSSNFVRCITKDSRGYMWFGTTAGLDRFDGYNIKAYHNKLDDSTSISNNSIRTIIEDDGGLLIGTSGGLNVFDFETEQFIHYKHNPVDSMSISHNQVNVIYKDSFGLIWLGTQNGLNIFDPSNETFKVFKQNPDTPKSKTDQINEIYRDTAGIIWIGTNDGLFQFHLETRDFKHIDLMPSMKFILSDAKIINTIIEDHNHILWVGTDFLIFNIFNGKQEWIGVQSDRPKYPTNYFITDIAKNSNIKTEQLWIATHWGLNKYDFKSKRFTHIYSNPDDKESIINCQINSLLMDENGMLWLATADGVDILNLSTNPFIQYTKPMGKFRHSAITFYEGKEGNYWIGYPNAGLLKFDKDLNHIKRYRFQLPNGNFHPNYSVFEILEDSKEFMWIGMSRPFPGIYLFDKEKESFTKVPCDTLNNHPEPKGIQAIIEGHQGMVWFGTNFGLYWFDNKNYDSLFIRFTDDEVLSRAFINDLYLDRNNGLWISSSEGLYWLPDENRKSMDFIKFNHDGLGNKSYQGRPNGVIQCKNGFYWLGTSEGLFKFNPIANEFYEVGKENELIGNNKIFSISEDKQGLLWLNTMKGLVRFNPQASENESPKLFDISDGLSYTAFNYSDLFISSDGRIFLPGRGGKQDGFYYFYPDSINYNQDIPPIVITKFLIKDENIYPNKIDISKNHIKLKYSQNFFSFEFAALDYIDPGKNQYAYYLEGLEDDWILCGNRRFVNYTNVAPGNYVFRVKGSNNDGYWNEDGASLTITILPPPWKTWWAYTIYGIILIGLIYIWRRYDLKRQHLKQELEIEHVEAEKLKELDTMKSRFFANISHEFRTPLTLILGPLAKLRSKVSGTDSEQDLNMMRRNAHRLQNLINQLLNLSKLESGKMKLQLREENIVALVNGYVQSFESLAKQKNVDLIFNSDEKDIKLFVDQDKIEKILYNLLSNAFKFTGEGGRIEVAVRSRKSEAGSKQSTVGSQQSAIQSKTTSDFRLPTSDPAGPWVRLSVSDTGPGIPPEKLQHIFDRFYQADDSYTKDREGTGIGLALTKELVEIQHGEIMVDSQIGKGTTFYIFLPKGKEHFKPDEIVEEATIQIKREEFSEHIPELEFLEDDLTTENNLSQDEVDGKEDKPYLLIVDDNADLRTYMRGYLDPFYYISEARDGKEGFNKATEKIPDLIISDVMMPKMDGYELCEKLKTDERTSHIPVILLTARASSESRIEGLETGADDFITKPFDADELLIRIKNLIEQRQKLRESFIKNLNLVGAGSFLQIDNAGINSADQKFLKKALEIVEQHLSDEDFNTEIFCEKIAMSRMQLYRKLKAITNQSATGFIRSIRLNKAAELISHKTGTITQIAFEVGFSSLSYFAKSFHEQFGVLPSEYGSN